jgi:hypothetical protein
MADLRMVLRSYYDNVAAPLSVEEILDRRHGAPGRAPTGSGRHAGVAVALGVAGTLIAVGGWLFGAGLLRSHADAPTPGSGIEDYRFSGIEWLGFEFAYPGERTTLKPTDATTLIDGPMPYPEYTVLLLEGVEDAGYVDVVWVSYQTGHGSVVRDALTVAHPRLRPDIRLGCAAHAADGRSVPAIVLRAHDGTTVLRAWFVDPAALRIEHIDPALVVCPPNMGRGP